MSYDIRFKAKLAGIDRWVSVCECRANITWNVREMIVQSTGLEWKNEEDNGLVKDVIPYIEHGLSELRNHRSKYKQYESPNGWGTIEGCKGFFTDILEAWDYLQMEDEEVAGVAHFWIE